MKALFCKSCAQDKFCLLVRTAYQKRVEKVYSVRDKVLLSTKHLNLKHAKTNWKLLQIGPNANWSIGSRAGGGTCCVQVKNENPGWRIHPVCHVLLLESYKKDGRVRPPPSIALEGITEV
jgi:hypothetical protein